MPASHSAGAFRQGGVSPKGDQVPSMTAQTIELKPRMHHSVAIFPEAMRAWKI
jgi:hypothetical protein